MDHQAVLEHIVEWAQSDRNIRALVLTGSLARNPEAADKEADLDVELYVTDPALLLQDDAWFQHFGEVLVVEALENPGWHPTRLVYYADGKIDFMIAPATVLQGSVEYDRPFRVLLDKDEAGRAFQRTTGVGGQPPTSAEFLECVHWFYAAVIMWAKYVARDDPWAAKQRDLFSKELLLTMLEWDHKARKGWDYDTWYLGVHLREWVDAELLDPIEACWSGFARQDSLQALRASLDLFDVLSTRTATALGIAPYDATRVRWRIDHLITQTGIHVHPLDANLTAADWLHLSAEEPPVSVRTFTQMWAQQAAQHTLDPWQVLVECAASVTPSIRDQVDDVNEPSALGPLRSLLAHSEQAAVVFGHAIHWTSPNQWGYMLQVRHVERAGAYKQVLLHPAASEQDLAQAEHVLGTSLPPSYRRFLLLTNGLGLDEQELSYVCGAGPQWANWRAVLLNQWMACAGQHEVAASWREFQGVLAYEQIMDRERGEHTFRSDETVLIPFAYTSDYWCFDRTRADRTGEYPIVYWDHELREATDRYPHFDAWFAGEVEPYLIGDA